MFIVYFFEGVIVGSLLGLLVRPLIDSYVRWHWAKSLDEQDSIDAAETRIDSAP